MIFEVQSNVSHFSDGRSTLFYESYIKASVIRVQMKGRDFDPNGFAQGLGVYVVETA